MRINDGGNLEEEATAPACNLTSPEEDLAVAKSPLEIEIVREIQTALPVIETKSATQVEIPKVVPGEEQKSDADGDAVIEDDQKEWLIVENTPDMLERMNDETDFEDHAGMMKIFKAVNKSTTSSVLSILNMTSLTIVDSNGNDSLKERDSQDSEDTLWLVFQDHFYKNLDVNKKSIQKTERLKSVKEDR